MIGKSVKRNWQQLRIPQLLPEIGTKEIMQKAINARRHSIVRHAAQLQAQLDASGHESRRLRAAKLKQLTKDLEVANNQIASLQASLEEANAATKKFKAAVEERDNAIKQLPMGADIMEALTKV